MLDRKLQGTLAFIGLTIFGLIWAISEILGLAWPILTNWSSNHGNF